MKILKSVIIVTSAVGLYEALKNYKNKNKPVRRRRINETQTDRYKNLSQAELKEQFKQRIASGEWLSKEEYEHMMKAIKKNN